MRTSPLQKVLRGVLFVLACLLVARGFAASHKVYDDDEMADEFAGFGMLTFQKISEAQLTIDATFSGTVRKMDTVEQDGKERKILRLYSTYNRAEPRGKKSCPT